VPQLSDHARVLAPSVRDAFPALAERMNGEPLVYLDSAATALKPLVVAEAVSRVYLRGAGAVDRSAHALGARATAIVADAREKVRAFVGAEHADEIVLLRGATEALNVVVDSWARPRLRAGDRVVVTALEHHANYLPWKRACEDAGAELHVVMPRAGAIHAEDVARAIDARTKAVAVTHVSNVTGAILPVREIANAAHAHGAIVIVDGAQGAAHAQCDIRALGADFYALSGHKLYGPSGTGALYGRRDLLAQMTPRDLGGGMLEAFDGDGNAILRDAPARFEAGTPNVEGLAGLGAALDFLTHLGADARISDGIALAAHCAAELEKIPGVRIVGASGPRAGIVSFVVAGVHPHDMATWLDGRGIAVRAGRLCAHPAIAALGEREVVRASFGVYNDERDVASLIAGVRSARAELSHS
jgi:cysteine desulfurase/selenocysteine lyase